MIIETNNNLPYDLKQEIPEFNYKKIANDALDSQTKNLNSYPDFDKIQNFIDNQLIIEKQKYYETNHILFNSIKSYNDYINKNTQKSKSFIEKSADFHNPENFNHSFRSSRSSWSTINKCPPLFKRYYSPSDILFISDLKSLYDKNWHRLMNMCYKFNKNPENYEFPFGLSYKNDFKSNPRRLLEWKVWKKKLNKIYYIELDKADKNNKYTKKSKISNKVLRNMKYDEYKQNEYLSSVTMLNKYTNETFTLKDVKDIQSKNTFNEIYFKQKVIQEEANRKNFDWLFITLTLPGRFHPNSEKFDGTPIKQSNEQLQELTRQVFKHLSKRGIKSGEDYMYCKVVEAHKDGCPHHHLLVYTHSYLFDEFRSIYNTCWKNRFSKAEFVKNVSIDFRTNKKLNQVSPASYIMKYVLKSLITYSKELDQSIKPVDAYWASLHSIRRYSFGGFNMKFTTWKIFKKLSKDYNFYIDFIQNKADFMNISDKVHKEMKEEYSYLKDLKNYETKRNNNLDNYFNFMSSSFSLKTIYEEVVNNFNETIKVFSHYEIYYKDIKLMDYKKESENHQIRKIKGQITIMKTMKEIRQNKNDNKITQQLINSF